MKCGAQLRSSGQTSAQTNTGGNQRSVVAPNGATSFKCPNCGAPLSPKFGEMVITCEYCGSGVSLGENGWSNIQKQSILPLKIATSDQVNSIIRPLMDKGLLHRHLQEDSKLEDMSLSYVPYWIVSVSARTAVVTIDEAQQLGQAATTAALMGVILGGMGGMGRRVFWDARIGSNSIFGRSLLSPRINMFGFGMMGGGMGGGARKVVQMDANYNFPVVALKALTAYQPRDYQFDLESRTIFDVTKISKNIKVLNGDISEEVARSQAKTLVDQLQSEKAHSKYHMIQQINTQSDVGDVELLHAPIWFARYDHKGKKIALVIDANSGNLINSMGL
jgi:hypothetical protein